MIVIDKWAGLVTNASPYAVPPGAAVVQTNLQCRKPGELASRGGQMAVTASTHAASTASVLSMMRVKVGADECAIYQNALGQIRVARGLQ